MNKIDLYLCVSASILTTGFYSFYQIKALGKNLDLRILFLIFYAFFVFGVIIKSLVFHDISEDLLAVLYDYNIKEFVASNESVIFYGLTITTVYFLIFNFFFWRFASRFKNSIRKVLKSRTNNQEREPKLSFIALTSLFSLVSLIGLISLIGPSSLATDFSAKRFNDAFSISTYIFFKFSLFSRIFYLYGRLNFRRLGFFGLPYLFLQAITILLSSLLVSNRSYLFLFVIEIILIEFINQREGHGKSKISSSKSQDIGLLKRRKSGKRKILLIPVISAFAILLLIITALRTAISQSLDSLQLVQLAFLKILSGRYLFDVMKLGEIYNFAIASAKDLTFYSVGWVAPLLLPNHKDIGAKIGVEIFGLNSNAAGGVTPGMFGELSYDFGIFLGALIIPIFCCVYWLIAQKIKPFIPRSFLPIFWVTLLSKFILALNSSFGACLFSFVFDIAAIYAAYLCDKVRLSASPQVK